MGRARPCAAGAGGAGAGPHHATILFALPFALVVVLMAISVTWGIHVDWEEDRRRDQALRRKMRELVKE